MQMKTGTVRFLSKDTEAISATTLQVVTGIPTNVNCRRDDGKIDIIWKNQKMDKLYPKELKVYGK